MDGAPYIGPRLGDEVIFEVSGLQLDAKEYPGKIKITHWSFIIQIVAMATIEFEHGYQSRARSAGHVANTLLCAIDGSHLKLARL